MKIIMNVGQCSIQQRGELLRAFPRHMVAMGEIACYPNGDIVASERAIREMDREARELAPVHAERVYLGELGV